jgi:phage shock protein A
MSILNRLKRIVRGNLNELVEKAEKPELLLKDQIASHEKRLKAAKEYVDEFAVSYKKSEREIDQLKRLRDEWQHKAEASLKAGDEPLAKRALEARIKAEARICKLTPTLEASQRTYAQLKEQVIALSDQLKEAKMRLAELQSRDRAAKAQQKFGKQVAGGSDPEGLDFARFEDQVMQKEAEVEIEQEMRGELSDLDGKLSEQAVSSQADGALEALKQQLSSE